jgi:hypothetical protein
MPGAGLLFAVDLVVSSFTHNSLLKIIHRVLSMNKYKQQYLEGGKLKKSEMWSM